MKHQRHTSQQIEATNLELREIAVYKNPNDAENGVPPLFVYKVIITEMQPRIGIEKVSIDWIEDDDNSWD